MYGATRKFQWNLDVSCGGNPRCQFRGAAEHNHILLEQDSATQRFFDEIRLFLKGCVRSGALGIDVAIKITVRPAVLDVRSVSSGMNSDLYRTSRDVGAVPLAAVSRCSNSNAIRSPRRQLRAHPVKLRGQASWQS
jgi:hypothetical protein